MEPFGGALASDSLYLVEHPLAAERRIEAAGGHLLSSPYEAQVSRRGASFSVLADDGNAFFVLHADSVMAERAMGSRSPLFVARVDSVRGGVRWEHFAATYDEPPEIDSDRSFGLVVYGRLIAVEPQ